MLTNDDIRLVISDLFFGLKLAGYNWDVNMLRMKFPNLYYTFMIEFCLSDQNIPNENGAEVADLFIRDKFKEYITRVWSTVLELQENDRIPEFRELVKAGVSLGLLMFVNYKRHKITIEDLISVKTVEIVILNMVYCDEEIRKGWQDKYGTVHTIINGV